RQPVALLRKTRIEVGQRRIVVARGRAAGGVGVDALDETLRQGRMIVQRVPLEGATRIDRRALFCGPVLTGAVEVLKRKTRGIHDLVTSGANRILQMQRDALTLRLDIRVRVLERREIDVR